MNNMFLTSAIKSNGLSVQRYRDVSYIADMLLDKNGQLRPVPSALLRDIPHEDLVYFCTISGFYSIPSIELLDLIREYIQPDHKTIEIGAGNGVYGRNLDLRMTDSFMQHPKNRRKFHNCIEAYEKAGQCLVPYGEDVEELDAIDAVRIHKPNTVFCAWVTQKYNPAKPHLNGNMFGVPFNWMYNRKSVKQIIMIGNKNVHSNVDIMQHAHEEIQCDDILFSRAFEQGNDRIFIWNK